MYLMDYNFFPILFFLVWNILTAKQFLPNTANSNLNLLKKMSLSQNKISDLAIKDLHLSYNNNKIQWQKKNLVNPEDNANYKLAALCTLYSIPNNSQLEIGMTNNKIWGKEYNVQPNMCQNDATTDKTQNTAKSMLSTGVLFSPRDKTFSQSFAPHYILPNFLPPLVLPKGQNIGQRFFSKGKTVYEWGQNRKKISFGKNIRSRCNSSLLFPPIFSTAEPKFINRINLSKRAARAPQMNLREKMNEGGRDSSLIKNKRSLIQIWENSIYTQNNIQYTIYDMYNTKKKKQDTKYSEFLNLLNLRKNIITSNLLKVVPIHNWHDGEQLKKSKIKPLSPIEKINSLNQFQFPLCFSKIISTNNFSLPTKSEEHKKTTKQSNIQIMQQSCVGTTRYNDYASLDRANKLALQSTTNTKYKKQPIVNWYNKTQNFSSTSFFKRTARADIFWKSSPLKINMIKNEKNQWIEKQHALNNNIYRGLWFFDNLAEIMISSQIIPSWMNYKEQPIRKFSNWHEGVKKTKQIGNYSLAYILSSGNYSTSSVFHPERGQTIKAELQPTAEPKNYYQGDSFHPFKYNDSYGYNFKNMNLEKFSFNDRTNSQYVSFKLGERLNSVMPIENRQLASSFRTNTNYENQSKTDNSSQRAAQADLVSNKSDKKSYSNLNEFSNWYDRIQKKNSIFFSSFRNLPYYFLTPHFFYEKSKTPITSNDNTNFQYATFESDRKSNSVIPSEYKLDHANEKNDLSFHIVPRNIQNIGLMQNFKSRFYNYIPPKLDFYLLKNQDRTNFQHATLELESFSDFDIRFSPMFCSHSHTVFPPTHFAFGKIFGKNLGPKGQTLSKTNGEQTFSQPPFLPLDSSNPWKKKSFLLGQNDRRLGYTNKESKALPKRYYSRLLTGMTENNRLRCSLAETKYLDKYLMKQMKKELINENKNPFLKPSFLSIPFEPPYKNRKIQIQENIKELDLCNPKPKQISFLKKKGKAFNKKINNLFVNYNLCVPCNSNLVFSRPPERRTVYNNNIFLKQTGRAENMNEGFLSEYLSGMSIENGHNYLKKTVKSKTLKPVSFQFSENSSIPLLQHLTFSLNPDYFSSMPKNSFFSTQASSASGFLANNFKNPFFNEIIANEKNFKRYVNHHKLFFKSLPALRPLYMETTEPKIRKQPKLFFINFRSPFNTLGNSFPISISQLLNLNASSASGLKSKNFFNSRQLQIGTTNNNVKYKDESQVQPNQIQYNQINKKRNQNKIVMPIDENKNESYSSDRLSKIRSLPKRAARADILPLRQGFSPKRGKTIDKSGENSNDKLERERFFSSKSKRQGVEKMRSRSRYSLQKDEEPKRQGVARAAHFKIDTTIYKKPNNRFSNILLQNQFFSDDILQSYNKLKFFPDSLPLSPKGRTFWNKKNEWQAVQLDNFKSKNISKELGEKNISHLSFMINQLPKISVYCQKPVIKRRTENGPPLKNQKESISFSNYLKNITSINHEYFQINNTDSFLSIAYLQPIIIWTLFSKMLFIYLCLKYLGQFFVVLGKEYILNLSKIFVTMKFIDGNILSVWVDRLY